MANIVGSIQIWTCLQEYFETAGYDRKKLKLHTDFAASGYNTNSVIELDVSDIDGDVDIVSNHPSTRTIRFNGRDYKEGSAAKARLDLLDYDKDTTATLLFSSIAELRDALPTFMPLKPFVAHEEIDELKMGEVMFGLIKEIKDYFQRLNRR